MILSILSLNVSSTSHSSFQPLCIDYFARANYEIIITLSLMPNTTRFRSCLIRRSIDKPEIIKLQTTKALNWRHRDCPRRSLLSVARLLEFYFFPCQLQSRFRISTTWRLLFDQSIWYPVCNVQWFMDEHSKILFLRIFVLPGQEKSIALQRRATFLINPTRTSSMNIALTKLNEKNPITSAKGSEIQKESVLTQLSRYFTIGTSVNIVESQLAI